ncbi:tyrosine-type recombinase/integrase [Actinoplanes sp. NPDC051343]|uniref:tyrosine-type recombinase/integrase n=1 Tax=Actinoplanes sp. NPDC051343 TaxID=3363906 RepID=UPI0037AA6286
MVARYDGHEQVTGPPLPHLFQRTVGIRQEVVSTRLVQILLTATMTRTGLRDLTGQPLHVTPHDFRRMFATEAVTGGLPVHIAAKILGHHHLTTTQAYLAVFQDDLIRTYRGFLDRRRAVRPEAEYRQPTDDEWREFHEHFQLRKLELGTCGRPYGTPCKHEHACIRCPMLNVNPKMLARLAELEEDLHARRTRAETEGWFGEIEGLDLTLRFLADKRQQAIRLGQVTGTVGLGMPGPRPATQ